MLRKTADMVLSIQAANIVLSALLLLNDGYLQILASMRFSFLHFGQ